MEVNGVLYDVPATARMSAIVEEKEDANESLKKQKLDEEAAKKIVEEQGEVKESTRGEKPEKKSLKQKVGEQWQLIIKCFELVTRILEKFCMFYVPFDF